MKIPRKQMHTTHRLRSWSTDEGRARWRRERLGLPGPVDRWVAPALPIRDQDGTHDAKPIAPSMARCLLRVEYVEVSYHERGSRCMLIPVAWTRGGTPALQTVPK